MGDYSFVEKHAGWAEIVINRPDRRNSLIPALAGEITEALSEVQADKSISAIVLRGAEGYFCSGIDLKALQAPDQGADKEKTTGDVRSMHIALYQCELPVIGALERFAINAGAALAFACDVLITGEEAFLQIGEIQQGASIPMNAAWMKIKHSELTTARLAFYGDRVQGKALAELGIATECVADDKVVERCYELAERMAGFPEGASREVKRAVIAQRGIADVDAFFPKRTNDALKTAGMVN